MTGLTAPKLVWVRDEEPEVWARAAHVLLPKDFVRLALTGEHALDKADGDQAAIYRPFVKRAWQVHRVADLARFTERAFWTATSGRPGAVLLRC